MQQTGIDATVHTAWYARLLFVQFFVVMQRLKVCIQLCRIIYCPDSVEVCVTDYCCSLSFYVHSKMNTYELYHILMMPYQYCDLSLIHKSTNFSSSLEVEE